MVVGAVVVGGGRGRGLGRRGAGRLAGGGQATRFLAGRVRGVGRARRLGRLRGGRGRGRRGRLLGAGGRGLVRGLRNIGGRRRLRRLPGRRRGRVLRGGGAGRLGGGHGLAGRRAQAAPAVRRQRRTGHAKGAAADHRGGQGDRDGMVGDPARQREGRPADRPDRRRQPGQAGQQVQHGRGQQPVGHHQPDRPQHGPEDLLHRARQQPVDRTVPADAQPREPPQPVQRQHGRQLQPEQPEQRTRSPQRRGPPGCSHRLPTFGRGSGQYVQASQV